MIELVEEYNEYDISPIVPALNEFSAYVQEAFVGINHTELNNRMLMEAAIYGYLVQTLDKYGLRTFGLATAIKKYYSYFVVEVLLNDPEPKTILEVKIPIS